MRSRILIGALIVVGVLTVGVIAAGDTGARQWSTMYLARPTLIAGYAVMGPILVVHDDEKMHLGGKCTAIYRFDPASGPKELIVEFACTPIERDRAAQFTATCTPANGSLSVVRLTEYQFAGDTEAHGVPTEP
jgi:hypothetical protein